MARVMVVALLTVPERQTRSYASYHRVRSETRGMLYPVLAAAAQEPASLSLGLHHHLVAMAVVMPLCYEDHTKLVIRLFIFLLRRPRREQQAVANSDAFHEATTAITVSVIVVDHGRRHDASCINLLADPIRICK